MGENPELIAMAREIVNANSNYMNGLDRGQINFTAQEVLQIALAAIIETRDCDAALAETLFDKGGCHAMYKNAGHQAAAAIRSGQHYGKDHPHA